MERFLIGGNLSCSVKMSLLTPVGCVLGYTFIHLRCQLNDIFGCSGSADIGGTHTQI